jgi:hypothetical protein
MSNTTDREIIITRVGAVEGGIQTLERLAEWLAAKLLM